MKLLNHGTGGLKMRLIDADAIKWRDGTDTCDPWAEMSFVKYDDIENMPTINAELVRHGHWIDKTVWCGGIGRCEYECSNCGYRVMCKPNSRGDGKGGKFCDECGAKMDGGKSSK